MKTQRRRKSVAAVLALVGMLLFVSTALAGSTTTLLGYQIDFLGVTDNGNGTSTWTYAVSASGDEDKALSHWTLGIGSCFSIASPANGSIYTTETGAAYGCGTTYTNCQASQCTVEWGTDATTGVTGIKFGDCSPQLDNSDTPRTHIFKFTVNGVGSGTTNVDVAVKPGNETAIDLIYGPQCSPSAIALKDFSAGPTAAGGALPLGAISGIVLAGGLIPLAWWARRRKQ